MKNTKTYRSLLPHIQPKNGNFFVTFRLKMQLPEKISQSLSRNYAKNKVDGRSLKWKSFEEQFSMYDNYLDFIKTGPQYLSNSRIADMICKAIEYRDLKCYELICYSIMSNHVHLVIKKTKDYLFNIMKSLKGYTAWEANKILGRKGPFWQVEYYDHLIRDKNDLINHINYTINNPVKAKLVHIWSDWRYTYLKEEYRVYTVINRDRQNRNSKRLESK